MIKQQKDSIREQYRDLRRQINAEEKFRRDNEICKAAESLMSYKYAEYVLLYAPEDEEIDIYPIAEMSLKKGKKICFPRCDKKNHTMEYHVVESLDELKPDTYGICEPPETNPKYDPDSTAAAVCFVPGLVYDRYGYRLGYGKGFYDRYLSRFSGCSIGVVYSDFVLEEVPRGRYDVMVDILLTEKGVRVTKSTGKSHSRKG